VCKNCKIHFADSKDLISKQFRGKIGTAFLFQNVINVFMGPESEKEMMTGVHVVSDVYCVQCSVVIGWTYVKAYEEDQKYKEGKFIIEKAYMSKQGTAPARRRISSDDNEDSSGQRRATSSNAALGGRDSSSTFNLSNILPALRGQLLRQALGLGRIQSARDRESSDDEFEL